MLQSVLHFLENLGDKRAEGLLGVLLLELFLEKEYEEGLQWEEGLECHINLLVVLLVIEADGGSQVIVTVLMIITYLQLGPAVVELYQQQPRGDVQSDLFIVLGYIVFVFDQVRVRLLLLLHECIVVYLLDANVRPSQVLSVLIRPPDIHHNVLVFVKTHQFLYWFLLNSNP